MTTNSEASQSPTPSVLELNESWKDITWGPNPACHTVVWIWDGTLSTVCDSLWNYVDEDIRAFICWPPSSAEVLDNPHLLRLINNAYRQKLPKMTPSNMPQTPNPFPTKFTPKIAPHRSAEAQFLGVLMAMNEEMRYHHWEYKIADTIQKAQWIWPCDAYHCPEPAIRSYQWNHRSSHRCLKHSVKPTSKNGKLALINWGSNSNWEYAWSAYLPTPSSNKQNNEADIVYKWLTSGPLISAIKTFYITKNPQKIGRSGLYIL